MAKTDLIRMLACLATFGSMIPEFMPLYPEALTSRVLAAAQDADEDSKSPQGAAEKSDEQKPALEGLRQPGDARVFELPDESDRIDPKNTEALSWYMAGLMAQKRGDLQAAADAFQKACDAAPDSAPPAKALGLVLLRMGRSTDGLEKARRAIELDVNDFETRLQLALILAQNGKPLDATEMVNAALTSDRLEAKSREFITIHQVRARLLLAQQKIAEAADSYEVIFDALERPEDYQLSLREHQALIRDRATGYDVTGRVLLEAGRIEKAIQVFEAQSRVQNDRPGEHHFLLAGAYFRKDNTAEAEKNLETYFRSGERSAPSLALLRDLYAATSRNDKLIEKLESLSEDASDVTSVQMFIGQTLLDQGKTDEAAAVFQKLLDDKGIVDAYLGLMRVEISRGNAATLLATMNRALRARIKPEELQPLASSVITSEELAKNLIKECITTWETQPNTLNPAAPFFCAVVANQLKDVESEGKLLQATLELNPDRVLTINTLKLYGMNLLMQDKYAQSARVYSQLVSVPGLDLGERLMALYRLSQAESFNDNHDASMQAIQTALRLAPEFSLLHYQHGWVLVQAEKYEEAEKILSQSLEQFTGDSEHTIRTEELLAGICARQARWNDAIAHYNAVLELEGADEESKRRAKLGLSNAYVQNGDMLAGEKILEEVYEQNPDDPGVNNDLGYLYADQGKNLEKAEKMIRIAVAAQPENSAYLDSLGWVLFKLGKLDEAVETLKKANANPEYQDATILEHLGDVYLALKQIDEAKAAYEKAVKIEQETPGGSDAIVKRITEKIAAIPGASADSGSSKPESNE
ncbi:MAG: tetratricopeptide repeat protein [Planctomyces sp.]|nr:tetratricopeptide repeat protein [Planctomyces sp.]